MPVTCTDLAPVVLPVVRVEPVRHRASVRPARPASGARSGPRSPACGVRLRSAHILAEWQTACMDDRTLDAVGPRLKHLRQRRDITLTTSSDETGISTSTLSRLEAGLRRPTLEQLLPLARAHGVTLDELVDAPPTGNPRINLRPDRGRRRVDGHARSPGDPAASRPTSSSWPPGATTPEPELRTHEGYDWVYVLDGTLRLVLGEHDLVLGRGRGRRVRHPDAAVGATVRRSARSPARPRPRRPGPGPGVTRSASTDSATQAIAQRDEVAGERHVDRHRLLDQATATGRARRSTAAASSTPPGQRDHAVTVARSPVTTPTERTWLAPDSSW